jgi:Septum formation
VWADDGEGRKFEGYIDGGDLFLADINPGNTVEGVLVFDIASDAVPAWIELHGSRLPAVSSCSWADGTEHDGPPAGRAVPSSYGCAAARTWSPRRSGNTRCGDRSHRSGEQQRRPDTLGGVVEVVAFGAHFLARVLDAQARQPPALLCSRRAASDLVDHVRSADTRRALCEHPYSRLAMSDFPPPPAPDQPQSVAQQAPRNGPGIVALILGIISVLSALVLGIIGVLFGFVPFFFWVAGILGIVGLFLGLIGYGRFQRSEASNGTTALWGIVTSAVAAVVVSLVGAVILVGVFADLVGEASVETENTASPAAETSAPAQAEERAPAEPKQVEDLTVGDCLRFSGALGEAILGLPTVPCSEPHTEEVFATVNLPEGDFPGMPAILAQGEEFCFAEFERFVGLSYEESMLEIGLYPPEEEIWLDGDRLVVCVVSDPDGDTTGTLANANR